MYVEFFNIIWLYRTNQPAGALCQSNLPIGYNFTTEYDKINNKILLMINIIIAVRPQWALYSKYYNIFWW